MEINEKSKSKIIRFCKVLLVEGGEDGNSEYGGLRIKVRLEPEDGTILDDNDLPYCYPLLPKMVHINPKVNETVMVILSESTSPQGQRAFIGPVISQPYFMNMDYHDTTSMSLLNGKQLSEPRFNPQNNVANRGTLPEREDIAILGRLNSDIILKPEEIRIRVGAKKNPKALNPTDRLVFNDVDMGYIQMRYDNFTKTQLVYKNGETSIEKVQDFKSIVNVVADRINLLSYDSPDCFKMNDREELITKDEIFKILENAHPVIYGDDFMAFMDKLIQIFKNHTHPFSMLPPVFASPDIEVLSTNTKQFLSKSVRVN